MSLVRGQDADRRLLEATLFARVTQRRQTQIDMTCDDLRRRDGNWIHYARYLSPTNGTIWRLPSGCSMVAPRPHVEGPLA